MNNIIKKFKDYFSNVRYFGLLTGAGISAESGIPTFRGAGGLWRSYKCQNISSPQAWEKDPGLVWEFYNYRRYCMLDKKPNVGHGVLASVEEKMTMENKTFSLVTQNIDDLHLDAGSKNVTRLHGSIWQIRCCACKKIYNNRDVPITSAYENTQFDKEATSHKFKKEDLPHCDCGGVLRPHVVWFGEALEQHNVTQAVHTAEKCDLFMVVGTSCLVHPAAQFINMAKSNGAKVAIVNLDPTPADGMADFLFHGKSGDILPQLFDC